VRSRSTCRDALALACAVLVASAAAGARAEEPAPIEVTARAEAPGREPARTLVSSEQARRVPGTGGDPLKAVEALPGVARTAFDSGKLVVWGAAASDTRVYVDGVEIPALFHGGGLRGVVSGDLVRSVEIVPGAFGAELGRGLGGAVRLSTRELPEDGVHGVASIDLLDAGATVTGAVGDRLRIAIGGRASYLDRLLARFVPDIGDFVPIPRYRDYHAKLSLALRPAESLDLVLLGSGDELDRAVPSPDPARVRRESTASSFHRALLRYTRLFDDGASVEITPFFGLDRAAQEASFGGVPAGRDEVAWKYGLRGSARLPLSRAITATFGVDALATRASLSRRGSLTLPPREGDLYVFGQPPGAEVNACCRSPFLVIPRSLHLG
jgi:outer membrane receptor protein involved in Fe transport